MKKVLAIILFNVGFVLALSAAHIKGGEMSYEYLGPGTNPNTSRYRITFKLYIDCSATSPGQLDGTANLSIFNKTTNGFVTTIVAGLTNENILRFDPNSNPCIGNPPLDVCYRVRTYSETVTLNDSPDGYMIAFQRCCRIIDIRNLTAPSNSYGATYIAEIPGTKLLADAFKNTGPTYQTNDASAICRNSAFTFDFGASEPDGDSLVYQLCNGFIGASQAQPAPTNASPPPYTALSYSTPYNGSLPLGGSVSINRSTGLVTGMAPSMLGQYVITACAYEYRKGVLINIHRKDIHIAVSDCIPLKALLKPDYSFCDDFLVSFKNEQMNPPGAEYTWDFGDNSPLKTSTSSDGFITHQYADTGTYIVKLKVILAGQCIDSTTTRARVYPGFFPGFTATGSCLYTPFDFIDTTKTRYGAVSNWSWSYGDEVSDADSGNTRRSSWLYNSLGIKRVRLIVESNKGCIDTVFKDIEVRDIPLMTVAFRDTLICSIDSVRLSVNGSGTFSWTGNNIINPNSANPVVYPKTTTTYKVTLQENGCVNTDSVLVRVVDFVTLNAGRDTTICLTDSIRLNPVSDGLQYTWTPSALMNDAAIKQPLVYPSGTTTYTVEARIGKCITRDNVTIRTVPYPFVDAGTDTVICFQDTAILKGTVTGSAFSWTPTVNMSRSNTLAPRAFPKFSTTFRLTAFDTLGCPKPAFDEVVVTVREAIVAFAGNDTAIVTGQPLKLNGSGAELFQWDPPHGLDVTTHPSPTAILDNDMTYHLRAYTEEGCFAMDTINVKVFKTQPDIFVPNAFVPEGKNRILRPITPGISVLHYFRVYNRWGQLVFQTSEGGKGWDGLIGGKLQDTGTYIWMVSGTDYTGKTVSKKGTTTLIR